MAQVSKLQNSAPVGAINEQTVLHLFSSNHRSLYVQDCLDLLALPSGASQRFRYRHDIVALSPRRGESTDAARIRKARDWIRLGKSHTPVIVYFQSIKDPAFGTRVSVPLRVGKIRNAFVEGDFFFVDFEVGAYIDQATFHPEAGYSPVDATDDQDRKDRAIKLTASLDLLLGERTESAIFGARPLSEGVTSEPTAGFLSTAKVLDDLLRDPTKPETAPSFMRVLGVRKARASSTTKWVKPRDGVRRLTSGTQYQLDTLQFRTGSEPGVKVNVTLAPALEAMSQLSQDLVSPYDVSSFEFLALPKDRPTLARVHVALDAEKAMLLPRAVFSVKVVPRAAFKWWTGVIVVGTALTAFLLAILSLDGAILDTPKDGVLDISWFPRLFTPDSYLGVSPGAIFLSGLAAIGSGLVAFGAAYRRRFGLDASA